MSSLMASVCEVASVVTHPNADALDIAVVKGWQTVVAKGRHSVGDRVVLIPPDALVPRHLAQGWGVEGYLSWQKRYADPNDTQQDMGRVRAVRLRGEMSYRLWIS